MRVLCCVVMCAWFMTGCQTHVKGDSSERDDLVGAPPSRQQDPFASQVRAPESAKAPTSGVMDVSSDSPDAPRVDDFGAPIDRAKTPRPARAEEARPQTIPPQLSIEPPLPEEVSVQKSEVHKCFSCVQICPQSDRSGDCSESKEDMICGWGTSRTRPDAQKLAQAECDATLDMAREMPRFSRIDGACPAASCVLD